MRFLFHFTSEESDNGHRRYVIDDGQNGEATQSGNAIMAESNENYFNDLNVYKSLLNENGCVSVKISSIIVRCSKYIHGFRVKYKCKFNDGRAETRESVENFFSSGYYGYDRPKENRELILSDDEYLRGIRVRQGDILDGITFVTNLREVKFGGNGGDAIMDDRMVLPQSHEIVALTGTIWMVVSRVGFYAKSRGWDIVGTYIMMKWLVDKNRASVNETKKRFSRRQNVLDPKIMGALTTKLPDLAFQRVLEYLI